VSGMRRAIVTAAALLALAAPAIAIARAPASSASAAVPCTRHLAWHTTRYKPVPTRATIPVSRRLGLGTMVGCFTTRGTARQIPVPHVPVYAVRGVRSTVAVALRPSKPALYVSNVAPTAAERAVLARLRGR
jgi:hypothetical protein